MTRPILCLTSESIQSPTRLDLAVVENLMLWPDDEEARNRAMRTAEAQFGRDNRELLPPELLRDILAQAVDSAPPVDLIAAAKDRAVEGFVAGTILYRAVRYHELDPSKATIGKTIGQLSDRLFPTWRLRPGTINNKVIPLFRPVVHFWASCVASALNDLDDGSPSVFPCKLSELSAFLSTAEAFRRRAESIRLPHAPRLLMDVGQAVEIPAALGLPVVDLEFS